MARLNTKAEAVSELSEVGYIDDVTAGATGLVNTAAAADQKVIVLGTGEGTSFTVGDLIRAGSGENYEVGQIGVIAVDTLTLDSNLMFTHAVGVNIVEQQKVPMGHVAEARPF